MTRTILTLTALLAATAPASAWALDDAGSSDASLTVQDDGPPLAFGKKLDVGGYGGIDVAFEAVREPGSFRTVHLVPGVEVRITDSLDFVAEAGLALNDSARHYFAGGLAFYVR